MVRVLFVSIYRGWANYGVWIGMRRELEAHRIIYPATIEIAFLGLDCVTLFGGL